MSLTDFTNVPLMWTPTENYGKEMNEFQKKIENKYQVVFKSYEQFHKWSIDNLSEFWTEIWEYSGLIFSKKFHKVLDTDIPLSESPVWFKGAELNFAENILKYRDRRVALKVAGEDRETKEITYEQVYEEVKLYAAALRKNGVKRGDVVVCQMSNREEAVFACLAVTSIGGIWTGALPLIGSQAVLSRFKQVNPKVFFSIDRFPNGGQDIDMLPKIKEITNGLPCLQKVVIVTSKEESHAKDISDIKKSCFLKSFLKDGLNEDGSVPPLLFEQVPFSHPVFVNYTSGTTGAPKALVHGAGVLLSTVRDYRLHFDSSRDSVWFSFSPVGWATWCIFLSMLFNGVAISLFEGVPYFLDDSFFWNLIEELKVTHIFLAAGIADELQRKKIVPKKGSLKHVKIMVAGGSVVKPELYDFVYKKMDAPFLFSSCYGSTEFLASCLLIDGTLPVYKCEIPAVALACDIYTVNEKGDRIVGELGELVLAAPMPNLSTGMWGDIDGSMYKEKYFSKYPGKFAMGDYAVINPVTKGINVRCRSDETLKQRGCRFGSSEIYSVVSGFREVEDCICVSKYSSKMDESAVLFLKMADGHAFGAELVGRIRRAVGEALTVRHVPDIILEVKDIPYNINGKKLEIVVKKIINKMPYNSDSVRNPQCLEYYSDIPELADGLKSAKEHPFS